MVLTIIRLPNKLTLSRVQLVNGTLFISAQHKFVKKYFLLKGTGHVIVCLGSGELVHEKPLKPVVIQCIQLQRCFKSRLITIQNKYARSCKVSLIRRELTRHAILWSQVFDSIKWPTALVRKVKGKPCTFDAFLCESLYSTFKTSF